MSGLSLLFLLLLFTLNYHSHADLIGITCKKTQSLDLCVSTLRSDPRSAAADVKGLARIIFDATLAKVIATLGQIKDLLKKTSDSDLREYLIVCAKQYESATDDISIAIHNDVGSHNFESRTYADAVFAEAPTCEDVFAERPLPRKRKSPFTAVNDVVQKLVMVASGIVASLG